MTETPPGFRTEPNPAVTSADRAPTNPDFRSADRKAGWLVVNRWTYRALRALAGKMVPEFDQTGLTISEVPGAGRGMRLVRPDNPTGRGAVLMIHGGGYVMGSNREALLHAAMVARQCGVPVFCPAYRLGPEHPFPAGHDDCIEAWTWLQDHAERYDIDPAKVVIGGISAGGGLSASLAQRVRDEGGVQPAGQLLLYPMLDDRTAARHELDKPRHRVWSNGNNRFGWSSYLAGEPGGDCPPYASPARRDDLSGLAPAWIGVGGADLFLDESRDYTRRLREAGVEATYVEIDGGIHGFDLAQDSPLTAAFYASATEFTRRFTS